MATAASPHSPPSYQHLYDAYEEAHQAPQTTLVSALDAVLGRTQKRTCNGFERMALLRKALTSLDNGGWQRSFHQKLFHDKFLCACSRVFWKTEKPGQFARDHQHILVQNGWDNLAQEILISTPRRWVLTIILLFFLSFPHSGNKVLVLVKARARPPKYLGVVLDPVMLAD